MRLLVNHRTEFHYDTPIVGNTMKLRIRPRSWPGQFVEDFELYLTKSTQSKIMNDHNGNYFEIAIFDAGLTKIVIDVSCTVSTTDRTRYIKEHREPSPLWLYRQQTPLTRPGRAVRSIASRIRMDHHDSPACMALLSRTILSEMPYRSGQTTANTTAEQAAAQGLGVCQDHTHVFISIARLMGLPARYVSGYLHVAGNVDQVMGHAWAEVFLSGLGWTGFDVSNGISPDRDYVKVAVGRDYSEAAPLSGIRTGPGRESMETSVRVKRLK